MKKLLILPILATLASCNGTGPTLEEASHKFVYGTGKLIEQAGQAGRNIGNAALGTDKDSNEDIEAMQQEIDSIKQDIADIQYKLDDQVAELYQYVDSGDNVVLAEVNRIYLELKQELKKNKRKDIRRYRRINRQLTNLSRDITIVRNNVNDLDLVCEDINILTVLQGMSEYCTLE